MSTGTIEKVAMAVQIDGKGYYVALPQDRLRILVKLAEGLSDNGKLSVQAMPPGHDFIDLKPTGTI
jgi:hypothetical protein